MNQRLIIGALLSFSLLSCMKEKEKRSPLLGLSPQALKDRLIEINKDFVADEDSVIEAYIEKLPYQFSTTGTGLRISVYQKGNGQAAEVGDVAVVKYKITDLKNNLIYQSQENETQSFLVGKDNVETGLHEAIQRMSEGSKAIIVLPAHLAHGLSGDHAKIPPQTALVYNLELVGLKNNTDQKCRKIICQPLKLK